jgi:RHS repeat-associated protein
VGVLYRDGCRVTHTFDAARRQTLMADPMGETLYGYDATGRVTSVAYPTGLALTYAFDALGQRLWMLDPNAGRTSYSYDPQGRLTGILNPFSEQTTITYDAVDRESHKTLANGMTVSHTYDAAGRETLLENRKSEGTALAVYTATYDARGDRLTVLELDGVRVTYAYDATSQLIQEQRSGANAYDTSYQYDPVGNRLVKDDTGQLTTYTYNPADELTLVQPPTGQPTTMSWDANGSLALENAGGALTTYTWDGEDRLIGIAYPDSTLHTYAYAPNGLRHRKETDGGTTIFVWDGQNVLMETDGNLDTQAQYTDSPGYWGGLASQRRGDASSFYGFDLQSTTRLLTSAAGTVSDGYEFKAFGDELAATGTTVNPLRYVGRYGYCHDTTAQLYVRARYLDAVLGRWLSKDPERWYAAQFGIFAAVDPLPWRSPRGSRQHVADSHPYAYCEASPVSRVDPSGLAPWYCYVICLPTLTDGSYWECIHVCEIKHMVDKACKQRHDCQHPGTKADCMKCTTQQLAGPCCEAVFKGEYDKVADCVDEWKKKHTK